MGTTAFSWSGLSVVALAGVLTAATPSVASSGDAPLPESELTQIRALRTDGRYQEAEDAARALLDRLGKQSGSTSMAIAGVLDELVAVLYDNGRRLDEASLALARRAVELRRNQPTDAFALATSLHNLGLLEYSNQRWGSAAEAFEEALEFRVRERGWGDPATADTLEEIAYLRFERDLGPEPRQVGAWLGQCPEALASRQAEGIAWAQESVAIGERALGSEHLEVTDSLNTLATLLARAGCYEAAHGLYERILRTRRAALRWDHPSIGRALHNLSFTTFRLGDLPAAIALSEEALDIRTRSLRENHPQIASSRSGLAALLYGAGDFAGAETHYRAAIKGLREGYGETHFRHATALHNFALFKMELGEYEEARDLLELAVRIRAEAGNERLGESRAALGSVLLRLGQPGEARTVLEQALREQEAAMGSSHPDLIDTVVPLAAARKETGDVEAARNTYRRAIDLAGGPDADHPRILEPLSGMAGLLEAAEEWELARRHLDRAVEVLTEAYGSELGSDLTHPQMGSLRYHRALVMAKMGDRQEALEEIYDAHEIVRSHAARTLRYLPERQALHYSRSVRSSLDLALALTLEGREGSGEGAVPQAYDAVVQSRALVLDEIGARHQRLRQTEHAVAGELAARLADARRALASALVFAGGRAVGQADQRRLPPATSRRGAKRRTPSV
jgi:tetratricopeptide (TPR) repeat protein